MLALLALVGLLVGAASGTASALTFGPPAAPHGAVGIWLSDSGAARLPGAAAQDAAA